MGQTLDIEPLKSHNPVQVGHPKDIGRPGPARPGLLEAVLTGRNGADGRKQDRNTTGPEHAD